MTTSQETTGESDKCQKGEWLIYRRPEDFIRGKGLALLVAMKAKEYDNWARETIQEVDRFPVIARGLTETQARAMIELTKEKKDDDEI